MEGKEEEEEEEEKRKKVTSRSTEELVLKNEDFWNSNGDITTGNTVANRASLLGYTFSEV